MLLQIGIEQIKHILIIGITNHGPMLVFAHYLSNIFLHLLDRIDGIKNFTVLNKEVIQLKIIPGSSENY
jgi:hypothetical protein